MAQLTRTAGAGRRRGLVVVLSGRAAAAAARSVGAAIAYRITTLLGRVAVGCRWQTVDGVLGVLGRQRAELPRTALELFVRPVRHGREQFRVVLPDLPKVMVAVLAAKVDLLAIRRGMVRASAAVAATAWSMILLVACDVVVRNSGAAAAAAAHTATNAIGAAESAPIGGAAGFFRFKRRYDGIHVESSFE